MKYEIGDKILELDLSYFKNNFHVEKHMIKEYTVKDANEKYFSPFESKLDTYFSGCNQYSIVHQNSGRPMYGNNIYYHKEKDKDLILELINNSFKDYDLFCAENDKIQTLFFQNQIKEAKEGIKQIKSGNGKWKSGFFTTKNKDYRERVLKLVNKFLDFEL